MVALWEEAQGRDGAQVGLRELQRGQGLERAASSPDLGNAVVSVKGTGCGNAARVDGKREEMVTVVTASAT